MKKCVITLFLFTFLSHAAFAQNEPLRVAIASFAPPFIMQSGYNKYYGFDIATVEYVCRVLDRPCEYLPMNLNDLIPTIQAHKADIAIGGIVYTYQRSRLVRFSIPYLISKGQFITTDKASIITPFKLKQLNGKRIGVLNGSVFESTLRNMEIATPRVFTFEKDSDMIEALHANTLDLALLSSLKAQYWQNNSAGLFKSVGNAFPVGLGFAIAIDPENQSLINDINRSIVKYQDSGDFKRNYNLYFPEKC